MKISDSLSVQDSYTEKGKTKGKADDSVMGFADILSVASESKTDDMSKSESVKSRETENIIKTTEKTKEQTASSPDKEVLTGKTKHDDVQNTVGKDDFSDSDAESAKTEDTDAVIEVISSILQDLSDILNLSVEDLTKTMEQLDFSANDLLNPDCVKELVLTVNQADATDLLVNEDLNSQLQTIMEQLNLHLDELEGISPDSMESIPVQTLIEPVSDNHEAVFQDNVPESDMEFSQMKTDLEPVVVVENNRMNQSNGDSDYFKDSKSDTTEELIVDSSKNDKEVHFENPVLQNIQDALNMVEDVTPTSETDRTQMQVIDQIVEQVKVQMNQDNTTLQMQLYPEHLGRIQINVVSKEGIMTAQIVAENDAAKQAIEGGLASLKETMENQNIKIEAIEVMVSTTGFQQNNEKNEFANPQSSKKAGKLNLGSLDGDEAETEDLGELEKMKASGSSVSYSA